MTSLGDMTGLEFPEWKQQNLLNDGNLNIKFSFTSFSSSLGCSENSDPKTLPLFTLEIMLREFLEGKKSSRVFFYCLLEIMDNVKKDWFFL